LGGVVVGWQHVLREVFAFPSRLCFVGASPQLAFVHAQFAPILSALYRLLVSVTIVFQLHVYAPVHAFDASTDSSVLDAHLLQTSKVTSV
jgi:surfactin synthase thioesterase subunit